MERRNRTERTDKIRRIFQFFGGYTEILGDGIHRKYGVGGSERRRNVYPYVGCISPTLKNVDKLKSLFSLIHYQEG